MRTIYPIIIVAVPLACFAARAQEDKPAEQPKQEERVQAEQGGEKRAEPAKGAAAVALLEAKLKEARAGLGKVTEVLDDQHKRWESAEKELASSKEKATALEKQLAEERAKQKELEAVVAEIENTHNGNHDREEALQREIADLEKKLAEETKRLDEVDKLERQAAELRKQAEALRKRAEELKRE